MPELTHSECRVGTLLHVSQTNGGGHQSYTNPSDVFIVVKMEDDSSIRVADHKLVSKDKYFGKNYGTYAKYFTKVRKPSIILIEE